MCAWSLCPALNRLVREQDIVITATHAKEPVLKGEWLAKGTHINAIAPIT